MSGTVAVPVARSRQLVAALPELLFVVGAFAVTAASRRGERRLLPGLVGLERARALLRGGGHAHRAHRGAARPARARLPRARHAARRLDAALERLVDRPLVVDSRGTARARSDRSRRRRARARACPARAAAAGGGRRGDHGRLRLRARHPALPGAGRQLRPARRLPAQHAHRLLERARRLRGDRGRDRARLRGPRHPDGHARGCRGEPARARADASTSPSAAARGSPSSRGSSCSSRSTRAGFSSRARLSASCPGLRSRSCSPRVRTP